MNAFPLCTARTTMAVITAGVAAFAQLTRGFTVATTESARRVAVEASPVVLPGLRGIDQRNRMHELLADPDHAGLQPRVTIVDFIYTRCLTVCSSLGSSYERLQAEIRARGAIDEVRLLTVSIDPSRDTPPVLQQYAQRMHADPAIWTVMSPVRADRLPTLLDAFGIVVVPAPPGQFQHNAAFHVVDRRGRLVRIVDLEDPRGALDTAIAIGRARSSS